MFKFLITLLTSYNEYILYLSYMSIIQQMKHNLDYTIIIIVNSLDKSYYNNVCKRFMSINVEIIQTESNGRPGKGHNSVLELFKNRSEYDYLIPIDGDDFLYPYALQQISKILIYNPTIIVGGNEDYICNFKNLYKVNDCYNLNHKYFLYSQPNIPIKKTFMLRNNGTVFRLILLHKSVFLYTKDKFYCETSTVFDDYLFYLNVLELYYKTQCSVYYITLKNIYFYYKAHISSACYQNSNKCTDDIDGMINKFHDLKKLEESNIILKIPILYINDVDNTTIKYKTINNDITYEKKDFINSNTFKINYDFAYNLSINLYNSTLEFIESKLEILDNYTFDEKKKLYLILENYILNELINVKILKYLLIICNNINYIAVDILNIIIDSQNDIHTKQILFFDKTSYKNEFNNKNYVSCYIITSKLIKNNINKSLYYYYYKSITYLYNSKFILDSINNNVNKENNYENNYVNNNVNNNTIQLTNKKTLILLDYMDIDYTITTLFKKGLGGTQIAYINLALELNSTYNIIILNKNTSSSIIKQHNIYTISYKTNSTMLEIINNIKPEFIIYNFIELGHILKTNTQNIKLIMYEHLTVYSNFNSKIKSNYCDYYDKIIFVSNDQYNDYKKYVIINSEKTIILNNTLSPLFYYNTMLDSDKILHKKRLNIIYISNPQRGLECFKYIFPILKKRYNDLTLDIYSSLEMYDIKDNERLKKMYSEFNNIDGINYNKSISQNELINAMNTSLLFIYPTFVVESFCNSLIEAMSCGCYVISTNLGALKSVAYPYGKFIDINIKNQTNHPYYESIDSIYIDSVVNEACKIIDLYLYKSDYLDNYLKEQMLYVKKMYKNNSSDLFTELGT